MIIIQKFQLQNMCENNISKNLITLIERKRKKLNKKIIFFFILFFNLLY